MGVDTTTIITFFGLAMFCFIFVFWMKKSENKYRYQKTKMVDLFISKRGLSVEKFFSGFHFDLVNDSKNKNIWFFVLRDNTLQYKQIPYEDLFQVAYKLDGHTIESTSRTGQLKRVLIGGEVENTSMPPAIWKKEDDFRVVKEVRLTVQIDDLQATTLDLIFNSYHLPIERKHIKDKDAREWFDIFSYIIESEERKRA